ncbi:ParB/RepB/Spo0J family partition protein [Sphingomonas sp.]|uniref:ParB/RepB/Spo0J family partition protein n=1 Tax=Sphingomonas sp. TaxID=28214 RepID=UPI000DAFB0C3|nr:ParB/RepB/Spo0J family partition protein [Sphingomonas sp.]PZU06521.1 MAG: chromosome partitioning protein ParB [Sphingomonas sp.]
MIQSVKVKNLSLSKDNVRKRNREQGLSELAASIAAQGLLQNLIVTPLKKAGTFTVKAGGRRLRAIQLLIEQGALPADHEVPVLVLDDGANSVGASLTENRQRAPMNPADECLGFKILIDQFDMTVEQVAIQQAVTVRFVEQRLRLADLAPAVFEALGAGEISLGVAQAYAVTADTDRQTRVFEQMKHAYYGNQPDNIRRAILNGTVKANDAKARFVGRDAYIAAGGRIEGDLFAQEAGDESWTDVDLLEELAGKKLEVAAAEFAQAQGLAFVTPITATNVPYDLERQLHEFHPTARALTDEEQLRVDDLSSENDNLVEQLETSLVEGTPEAESANDRLDAIERELDEIDDARKSIDPSVKAQLGTFVYIGGDGQARVHARLFSEKPVVDPSTPPTSLSGNSGNTGNDDEGEQGARLSATLVDELATQRRQILVAHLASDPAIALDLTIFLMAQEVLFATSYVRDHSTLKAGAAAMPILTFRDEGSQASQSIEDQRQHLDTGWAGHPTMSARFDAFRGLDEQARGAWVAYAIAQTLEPTLNVAEGGRVNGFHDHLGRTLGIEVAAWWRPTAENFFGRVKKGLMLDALEEIGGPILRGRYKDAKKADLASTCASLCNGQGIVEAEIREKAIAWLPDAMRFDAQEKPERVRAHSTFVADEAEDDVEQDDDGADDAELTGDDDASASHDDEDFSRAA